MLHLDEGTIHGWLDGELADAERARVERHVTECEPCAAAVAEARGMIAGAARIVLALDSVPGGVIPKAPPVARRSRSLWRTLGVTPARAAFAATLLIAVAATLAKRHDRTSAFSGKQPVPTVNTPAAPRTQPIGAPAADSSAAPSGAAHALARGRAKIAVEPKVRREPPPATRVPATPAPAAAAQPAAGSAGAIDTTMNRNSAMAGAAARFTPRRAAAVTQLDQAIVTSSVVQTGFAGCYRVTSDSLVRAGIPQRFALQVATSEKSSAQNVVRLVAPNDRIDSALAGGTWRELSPRVANVSFTLGAARTLRLELTPSGAIVGQVEEARQSGEIVRASCQP